MSIYLNISIKYSYTFKLVYASKIKSNRWLLKWVI